MSNDYNILKKMDIDVITKKGIASYMGTEKYKKVSEKVKEHPNAFSLWANEKLLMFKVYCSGAGHHFKHSPDLKREFIEKAKELGIK